MPCLGFQTSFIICACVRLVPGPGWGRGPPLNHKLRSQQQCEWGRVHQLAGRFSHVCSWATGSASLPETPYGGLNQGHEVALGCVQCSWFEEAKRSPLAEGLGLAGTSWPYSGAASRGSVLRSSGQPGAKIRLSVLLSKSGISRAQVFSTGVYI